MRIVWATPRALVGSVERGALEASKALTARGHEMHALLPGAGPLAELLASHATVHIAPSNPWTIQGGATTIRWLGYNVCVAVRAIAALIERIRPDVLVSDTIQLCTPAIAARARRVPHAWFLHGLPSRQHVSPPLLLGTGATLRLVDRLSRVVLCISEALRREIAPWVPLSRSRVVWWAAEVPRVRAAARPSSAYRLVIVGWKTPGKGQHEALQALRILRDRGVDAELDVVGDSAGGYERELVALADRLGIAPYVRFMPHRDDALALVAASDVALKCARQDAFPRVTIEAMKLGVPVVAAADYGVVEQVEDGRTGLLYEPGRPDQLASRVEFLYRHPGRAAEVARAGRAWAWERFNLERYGDQLEAALGCLAGR